MRHSILFYLNGKRHEISGTPAFMPLSHFLREEQRLCGTKVVCAEGACGACTVLVGTPALNGLSYRTLSYRALNSCLLSVHQVHGCHVVTVEGISRSPALSAVQQALVAGHGAQCGFCTPGMVMTLTGVCESGQTEGLPDALCGNLCRCTGYLPILESAALMDRAAYLPLNTLYPGAEIAAELHAARQEPLGIDADGRRLLAPLTCEAAAEAKRDSPEAVFVAGATELGVQWKKDGHSPRTLISLAALMASATVRVEGNELVLDAGATWAQVEAAVRADFPVLARLLERFAGPQIKNAGTVGGQIAQNSPIGDALPLLHVLEARLELVGPGTRREIGMDALESRAPDELIQRVRLPLPMATQRLHLEKVTRRAGFDRSVVSAALRLTVSGDTVTEARLAYGGVAPRVRRLPRTEAFLAGQPLTEAVLRQAGEVLKTEIAPADDARGSRDYKALLAANLLLRALDFED